MNTEDKIKDLFADKLGQLESPVNPDLWNAIASKVAVGAASSASATSGISILSKTLIGIGAASVASLAIYLSIPSESSNNERFINIESDSNAVALNKEIQEPETINLEASNAIKSNDADGNKSSIVVNERQSSIGQSTKKLIEMETATGSMNVSPEYLQPTLIRDVENKPSSIVKINPNNSGAEEKVIKPKKQDDLSILPLQVAPVDVAVKEIKDGFELTKLPNIYVLNASGYFSVGHKGNSIDFQFTLMDAKNRVVFKSNDPNFEWRGMDEMGNLVDPGQYVYIITAVDANGKAINKYSPLTIINQ